MYEISFTVPILGAAGVSFILTFHSASASGPVSLSHISVASGPGLTQFTVALWL